jgi:transcriptional regulator with XRE-family HTH domain
MATAVRMAALLAEQAERSGLNQRQFADLVGASAKHVNLVFNGRVTAHADTLDDWAAALGVRFDVAMLPEPPTPAPPRVELVGPTADGYRRRTGRPMYADELCR